MVYSKGNSSQKKKKKKLHQIEFLGASSGSYMVGGRNGAAEQSGSFGMQRNGAA